MTLTASHPPLRLLVVADDTGRATSLADAVTHEFSEASEHLLVGSVPDALLTLRSEPCDAIVALNHPPQIDALMLARALRGAGEETPLAILGTERAIDAESAAWEAGADEYACLAEVTAAQLAGRLRRAIDARERLRESRRLLVADQQRLARERLEAELLVGEQQRLVAELSRVPQRDSRQADSRANGTDQSAEAAFLRLVGTALVDGKPTGIAMAEVADELAAAAIAGPRLFELHLAIVNETVRGMEPKAERVVRVTADRLLIEAVVHLAEAYRRRYAAAVEGSAATGPLPATPAARAA